LVDLLLKHFPSRFVFVAHRTFGIIVGRARFGNQIFEHLYFFKDSVSDELVNSGFGGHLVSLFEVTNYQKKRKQGKMEISALKKHFPKVSYCFSE